MLPEFKPKHEEAENIRESDDDEFEREREEVIAARTVDLDRGKEELSKLLGEQLLVAQS